MIRLIVVSLILSTSCATTRPHDPANAKQPPVISQTTSIEEAVDAAIEFGGDTARSVRKAIVKRKVWGQAEAYLLEVIQDKVNSLPNDQLANALMLYVSGPVKPSSDLFRKLVESERPVARQLGWQMAAALPSKIMQKAIERELNRALIEGDESGILVPQMALAVQSNRMISAYTIVRQGLMEIGHEDFASAMAVLNPERATADFIDYLATCPPEELRQLSVSTINIYAANIALNHLAKNLPVNGHPKLEVLFYYTISRNPGLSELAGGVVDALAAKDQRSMAIMLSRLPPWTQVAYIENARRNMTPTKRVFLSELKKTSPQSEVADELGEIQF